MCDYKCKIPKLNDGDVILVHNYSDSLNPLPILIQAATRCYYHHCAIILGGFVYESTAKGVGCTSSIEDYFKEVGNKREVVIVRPDHFYYANLTKQVGLKYGFWSLVIQSVNQIIDVYLGSSNPNSRNCSQFVAQCIGYKDWAKIDPQDIFRDHEDKIIYESVPKRRKYINNKLNS